MNEQIKKALAPLKQFWANTSNGIKKVVIGGAVAAVIIALVLSILLNINAKDYVVIFDELSNSETSEVLAALQGMDVEVKVDDQGSIMVPREAESKVRMQLATAGYPKNGLSYYLIEENSGMLTTDFERKQYMNMQLQERIAASIKTLDGVKDAVVTITVPADDVFYLQEKEKPTASVIIHMKQGQTLTSSQITGIQNLVAKSVNGLTQENIALSDNLGNDLVGSNDGKSSGYSKLGITREIENDIKKKITSVLLGPYRSEEFKVSVAATVNTDELVREETTYTPSEDGQNSGVISEETRTQESSSSSQGDGGVAGTSSNSEIPTYSGSGTTGSSSSSGSSDHIKYQVNQTKSQTQKSGATIESISIGIAIDKASFSEDERDRVVQLVSYAAGVDPAQVSVQNFRFYSDQTDAEPPEPEGGRPWLLYIAIGAGVLILASALTLILMKKRVKQGRKKSKKEFDMEESMDSEDALNELFGEAGPSEIIKPITPVQDAKREEIKEFAKSNPDIAAQMIKSWLKSEE